MTCQISLDQRKLPVKQLYPATFLEVSVSLVDSACDSNVVGEDG